MLPKKARFGVYVAYQYYISLFEKIKKSQPANLLESRIRVPDISKAFILMSAKLRSQLNLL
jgi:phytoene/squalene synthetase